ncbi:choice-of-anchor J domain-containing protein [Chryseobacterium sp.]|uniref:choice-of-anchor J domain-containing protein n=1 Tax=Chryseobacterium sp. TaxID=1871047 RepID=UPI00388D8859
MKKVLLLGTLLCINTVSAQTTIFEDSFETYADFAYTTGNVGAWTMTDLDLKNSYTLNGSTFPNQGIPKAFMVFNRAGITPATVSTQTQARTGNKSMACFNVSTPAPLVNNDWLISPQMTLGSTGNSLSFWVKPLHADYGAEKFNVLVSTTGVATTSFTRLNPVTIVTPSLNEWALHTFNLDAYAGQNVRIAIQCVSDDQFALFVDDFKVTTTGTVLSTNDNINSVKSLTTIFPNPTSDVLNIKSDSKINKVTVVDMTGRNMEVKLENDKVNVQALPVGSYLVNIETKDGISTEKFIKK